MKKYILLLLAILLTGTTVLGTASAVLAQEEPEVTIYEEPTLYDETYDDDWFETYDDDYFDNYDDDYYDDDYYDYDYYEDDYYTDDDDFFAALIAVYATVFLVMGCLMIPVYIYMAYSLMVIAKKTGVDNAWLAWIPFGNLYIVTKIADQSLWTILLYFLPFVSMVWGIYIWMKMSERRGFPEWYGILMIVPIANFILPGYLAFAEPSSTNTEEKVTDTKEVKATKKKESTK